MSAKVCRAMYRSRSRRGRAGGEFWEVGSTSRPRARLLILGDFMLVATWANMLEHAAGPPDYWGSRGRGFKSRRPDSVRVSAGQQPAVNQFDRRSSFDVAVRPLYLPVKVSFGAGIGSLAGQVRTLLAFGRRARDDLTRESPSRFLILSAASST